MQNSCIGMCFTECSPPITSRISPWISMQLVSVNTDYKSVERFRGRYGSLANVVGDTESIVQMCSSTS